MKYKAVATGGTFDHLHRGHAALLAQAFDAGDRVVVGVTSDALAAKEGKSPDQSYDERAQALDSYIRSHFPGREYLIARLDDYFGPGIASPDIEAIVATPETASRVGIADSLRAEKGLPPLKVVVVPYVLAGDGKRISSTRIRSGEIDESGALRRHPKDGGAARP